VWKPMHLQPVFARYGRVGGSVAEDLYTHGLCLPSGSSLSLGDLERVVQIVRRTRRSLSPRRMIAKTPTLLPT